MQNFKDCVIQQLVERGFGQTRIDAVIERYDGLTAGYEADGKSLADAAALASVRVIEDLELIAFEKAKRTRKTAETVMNITDIMRKAKNNPEAGAHSVFLLDARGGDEVRIVSAAKELIEHGPRHGILSFNTKKEITRSTAFQMVGEWLGTFGKGDFGRQLGKAHIDDIPRELMGTRTGNQEARQVAEAFTKAFRYLGDEFNASGGSLRFLDDFALPQVQSSARVTMAGKDRWMEVHRRNLNWEKMRWPNGSPIEPRDHERVLNEVWEVISTDGAHKLSEGALRGQGVAMGNMLEHHRFLVYKDGDAWLEMHKEFGDGNVIDVLFRYIEVMSHKIAAVQTFSANPEVMRRNIHHIARKEAMEFGPAAQARVEGAMKTHFDPMFNVALRTNPMDPNSMLGNVVTGTGHMLVAAKLGKAVFAASGGDFMQSMLVRGTHGMNPFRGVGWYLKSVGKDRKHMEAMAAQNGYVMHESVLSLHGMHRFLGESLGQAGPELTRRISDGIMRASLMSLHTRASRWVMQAETMGLFARSRNLPFDELPIKRLLERSGITARDWDTFRTKVKPFSPEKGVEFLRPLDLRELGDRDLYHKFQAVVFDLSYQAVPDATIEATTKLKGDTRPDTWYGAALFNFGMIKNFPVTFVMNFGRLGMSLQGAKSRLGYFAALAVGMTAVGAFALQMKEIVRGRLPMDMDTAEFWGRAFMSGGGAGILGDLTLSGVNRQGGGMDRVLMGPIGELVGDTKNLVFGDAQTLATLSEGESFDPKTLSRSLAYVKKNNPGASLWWLQPVMDKLLWEQLELAADPRAALKAKRKEAARMKAGGGKSLLPEYGKPIWD